MNHKTLSPREVEIIDLSIQGLTNEAIANHLGLSVGTVNTYWMRIRVKVGGFARTDIVAKVMQIRNDEAFAELRADAAGIETLIKAGIDLLLAEREEDSFSFVAARGLIKLAVSHSDLIGWATDPDLRIRFLASAKRSAAMFGPGMALRKNLKDVFGPKSDAKAALQCHLDALQGKESSIRIPVEGSHFLLSVLPITDEDGSIIGCVSILNPAAP